MEMGEHTSYISDQAYCREICKINTEFIEDVNLSVKEAAKQE